MESSRICKHYLGGWFGIDLVSVIPYETLSLIFGNSHIKDLKALRILRLARLTKLARVLRAGRTLRRLEAKNNFDYKKVQLAKFMVITLSSAHWMACGWKLVTVLEESSKSWIVQANIPADDPFMQYLASLYWAAMTISTIGYGDIMGVTSVERTYAIVAMLVGASLYAYLVGNICGILASFNTEDAKFYQTMDSLNIFMDEKRMPDEMRPRLREYFRYHWHNRGIEAWQNLIDLMSPALRGQVLIHTQARWVQRLNHFAYCPLEFVTFVAAALSKETFTALETIIQRGEAPERMFVIVKGLVAASWGAILSQGQDIGDDALTTNTPREYSCTTITLSVAMVLHRDDLLRAVEQFPQAKAYIRRSRIRKQAREQVIAFAKAAQQLGTWTDKSKKLEPICVSNYYSLQKTYEVMIEKMSALSSSGDYFTVHKAVHVIQRSFTRFKERQQVQLQLNAIVKVQSCIRRAIAKMRVRRRLQEVFIEGIASMQSAVPSQQMVSSLSSMLEQRHKFHREVMTELSEIRRRVNETRLIVNGEIRGLERHLITMHVLPSAYNNLGVRRPQLPLLEAPASCSTPKWDDMEEEFEHGEPWMARSESLWLPQQASSTTLLKPAVTTASSYKSLENRNSISSGSQRSSRTSGPNSSARQLPNSEREPPLQRTWSVSFPREASSASDLMRLRSRSALASTDKRAPSYEGEILKHQGLKRMDTKRSSDLKEFKSGKVPARWGHDETEAGYSDPMRFMRMGMSSNYSSLPTAAPNTRPRTTGSLMKKWELSHSHLGVTVPHEMFPQDKNLQHSLSLGLRGK